MEFDAVIDERRSIRNFKESKKPAYSKIIRAIETATKVPLAGNLPCLKFILVSDKIKISELAQACQQDFVAKANYVVVICSDKRILEKYYYERAEKYSKQQAGAAIENFLLKITDLELASCWVGAFSDETVKRILRIPDFIEVEAILPVGYAIEETKPKKAIKPNLDTLLFFDKYNNKFMTPVKRPEA